MENKYSNKEISSSRKNTYAILSITLSFVIVLVPVFFIILSSSKVVVPIHDSFFPEITARGDRVVAQLQRYKGDFGEYPKNLQILEKAYDITIELPYPNTDWCYSVADESHIFQLACPIDLRIGDCYPKVYFQNDIGVWAVDR